MNRRTLLKGLPLAASIPLQAAQRKVPVNACSQGVELAHSRLGIESGSPIVAASPELLVQQLEVTCSMVGPFIDNRRQAELGFTVQEDELPSMLTEIGGNVSLLAHYYQSSGMAGGIDASLLEHGRLGFYELMHSSAEFFADVSKKLADYNVDLPPDHVRQLLAVSLQSEEMIAINAFLAGGGSTVQFFLEGAGQFYQEANRLRSVGLSLSRSLPRGRTPFPTNTSLSGENRRKANKVIAGMILVAATAGVVCYGAGVLSASPLFPAAATVAAAACPTAAIVGVLAAGIRFAIA